MRRKRLITSIVIVVFMISAFVAAYHAVPIDFQQIFSNQSTAKSATLSSQEISANSADSITVHYYSPTGSVPNVYYWNSLPENIETEYPGPAMESEGDNWFTHTFSDVNKINLMFVVDGVQSKEFTRYSGEWYYNNNENGQWSSSSDGVYTAIIENLRLQVLSKTMIRLEEKGPKGFEDRESFHIVKRDEFEGDSVIQTEDSDYYIYKTSNNYIYIPKQGSGLMGCSITDLQGRTIWKYTTLPSNKLYLPQPSEAVEAFEIADTPRIIPPEWGFNAQPVSNTENFSSNGWDLSNNAKDMYILLPQNDHKQLRKDFVELTGKTEMLPLAAFGAWDSRYYTYTQQTAMEQITGFHNRDLPLDILVIDTDWRESSGRGIGYDINTNLFPNMPGFIDFAHNNGVKLVFNDHPEPTKTGGYENDVLNPNEAVYRSSNLQRILGMGLDSWWFDRNWTTTIKAPNGFTHEVMGMAVYTDSFKAVYPKERLLLLSNIDGNSHGYEYGPSSIAAHRYGIQWTGDTNGGQELLMSEIAVTINRGVNSALPYVSTDLGGHQSHTIQAHANSTHPRWLSDSEYLRWMQFGTLSPIFRPHVAYNGGRMPWLKGTAVTDIYRDYMNMRYRLFPVFYNLSHESYETGMPILRSMQFDYPEYAQAKDSSQYMLGDDILVAPITSSNYRSVWIPPGEWINMFTGESVLGPKTISVHCDTTQYPIYIKSGSIVPLANETLTTQSSDYDWSHLTLDVFPSASNDDSSILYEDDTHSTAYENGQYRTTELSVSADKASNQVNIRVAPALGSFSGVKAFMNRDYTIRVHKTAEFDNVLSVKDSSGESLDYTINPQGYGSMPFMLTGGSPDGDVIEINVENVSVETGMSLSIEFSSIT